MLLALIVTALLTSQHDQWDVHFDAHTLNVALEVVTDCKGTVPYFALDIVPITADMTHQFARRQQTPLGERCSVVINVLRNDKGGVGDPNDDYVGESALIIDRR